MSEPREPSWQRSMADIVNDNEVRHANHLEKAALLEDGYGIPIDKLRKIYGKNILNCFHPDAQIITRWLAMCDTLRSTDKPLVAFFALNERPSRNRLFDDPNEPLINIAIIANPRDAVITFDSTENGGTAATLHARGYRLLEPYSGEGTYDDLLAPPQELSLPLVSTTHGDFMQALEYRDLTAQVFEADNYWSVFSQIEQQPAFTYEVTDARRYALAVNGAFNRLLDASGGSEQPWAATSSPVAS